MNTIEDVKDKIIQGATVGKDKSCATFVMQFVCTHSNCVDSPLRISTHFLDSLDSTEQAYTRRMVTKEGVWQPLDLGWFADKPVGYLFVKNIDIQDPANRVLIAVDGVTICSIGSGKFFNIEPEEGVANRIKLKAIGGDTQIFVTVIPK